MTTSVSEHAQRETNMSADAAAAPRRLDRRKARTRAALVGAAQRFLADGKTNVSIQEITDAADVGFGSFYNHFSTKDELFADAVSATLDTWGTLAARDDIDRAALASAQP
jgi:AcrR family transcriptional regulator